MLQDGQSFFHLSNANPHPWRQGLNVIGVGVNYQAAFNVSVTLLVDNKLYLKVRTKRISMRCKVKDMLTNLMWLTWVLVPLGILTKSFLTGLEKLKRLKLLHI